MAATALVLAGCGTAAPAGPSATPSPEPSAAGRLSIELASPIGLLRDGSRLFVSQCTFVPGASLIYQLDPGGEAARFAGDGKLDFGGDNGPALNAHIACPAGMTLAPDGAFVFADHANNRIRRIDPDGTISTIAGSGPAGVDEGGFSGDGGPAVEALLQEPLDVVFDKAGNLYISDRDNDRIRKVDHSGVITTFAGNGDRGFAGDDGPASDAELCGPQGIEFDLGGDLLIADDCNDRVRAVAPDGTIRTWAGNGANGAPADGRPATETPFDGPYDFAVTPNGTVYVTTNPGLHILAVSPDGTVSITAGTGSPGSPANGVPATETGFAELYGLALTDDGGILVADGNQHVYSIGYDGLVTLYAGR